MRQVRAHRATLLSIFMIVLLIAMLGVATVASATPAPADYHHSGGSGGCDYDHLGRRRRGRLRHRLHNPHRGRGRAAGRLRGDDHAQEEGLTDEGSGGWLGAGLPARLP